MKDSYIPNPIRLTDFLKKLNLKQEPPRIRTVRFGRFGSDHSYFLRLAFPWVSVGEFGLKKDRKEYRTVHAFFHSREWKNDRDAARVVRLLPQAFHVETQLGYICTGHRTNVKLSPQQLFWMTVNSDYGYVHEKARSFKEWLVEGKLLPKEMFDIEHPKRVLSYKWETLDLEELNDFDAMHYP